MCPGNEVNQAATVRRQLLASILVCDRQPQDLEVLTEIPWNLGGYEQGTLKVSIIIWGVVDLLVAPGF